MADFQGNLRKMHVSLTPELQQLAEAGVATNVQYALALDDQSISLNEYIGGVVKLQYAGSIDCIHCGRKTNKSFSQGYCYPCFKSLARCDLCIVSPEKCHFHLGTCREPEWAQEFCMQDHFVYLANSSGLKVGLTRGNQIPTRWVDQGAMQALPIYRVKTRLQAGLLETAFKSHVADKTNWRALLKGEPEQLDLQDLAKQLTAQVKIAISQLQSEYGLQSVSACSDAEPVTIRYPVLEYPQKISSFNLDKNPTVEGTLLGIKGQYMIFDTGVINMRKFAGYHVAVTFAD